MTDPVDDHSDVNRQAAHTASDPGSSFGEHLQAEERNQLDAQAVAAEQERDEARDERDQLRYERRLLGAARMVLARVAESGLVAPSLMAGIRDEAADMAQRIVDEIGHPVTDEPALGPDFRAEITKLREQLADAYAVGEMRSEHGPEIPAPKLAQGGPVKPSGPIGRQYEGERSPACPGDGQPGHWHDIRCVRRNPAPKLAQGGIATPRPTAGKPEPQAKPSEPVKREAFDVAREALLTRYGTLDPDRMRLLGADSTEIGAAKNIVERDAGSRP